MSDISVDTLTYIEKTGEALSLARQLAEDQIRVNEKVAELGKSLVGPFVDSNLIRSAQADELQQKLASHVGALTVIRNLLGVMGEMRSSYEKQAAIASQGRAVAGPSGSSVADVDDNYVGRRRPPTEKTAADRAYLAGLGLSTQS